MRFRANFRVIGPTRESEAEAIEDYERFWNIIREQAPDLVPLHKQDKGKRIFNGSMLKKARA